MAGYGALAATGQAIVGLLSAAAGNTDEFAQATFRLASSADLQRQPGEAVLATAYLYRVEVDTTHRNLAPRRAADGRMHLPPVPINLHYLITAWSRDPITQHRLLGWCVRVLQDTPTLGPGVLNQFGPEPSVFRPDETVELLWEVLTRQEMTDAWEVAKANTQPSVSYMARIIEIESDLELREFPRVQTTDLRYEQAVGS